MAVIVFDPSSSGGLLPTPPPSKRLLQPQLPCSFSTSGGFVGGYSRKSCSLKSSNNINSATPTSLSPSPPRQNHQKKQKTATTASATAPATQKKFPYQRYDDECTEKKKVFYGGASFSVPSPPPDSLPLPSFLIGGLHTATRGDPSTEQEASTTVEAQAASDIRRRRQYSLDFLLSLSQSAPSLVLQSIDSWTYLG